MKIVAFNGSPRKGGNTELLIKEVFKPIQEAGIETELVQLGGKLLRGCASCYTCFKTKDGKCAIKTDPMNEFIQKAQEADGIILASPTYYGSVSAEMKAFMDRLGLTTIGQGRTLTRKVGAAVISVRRGGANIPAATRSKRQMVSLANSPAAFLHRIPSRMAQNPVCTKIVTIPATKRLTITTVTKKILHCWQAWA